MSEPRKTVGGLSLEETYTIEVTGYQLRFLISVLLDFVRQSPDSPGTAAIQALAQSAIKPLIGPLLDNFSEGDIEAFEVILGPLR